MVTWESSTGVETILTSCCQLRFWWHEDRWRHEVASVGPAVSLPRLASVEAAPDAADPSRVISPAYQQIHLDRDPAGAVRAFLVGQAGPHHFSAAFLVSEDADGATIDVDVADRCLTPVQALAATYAIEATTGAWGMESTAAADGEWRSTLVLDCSDPISRLTFALVGPGHHAIEEAMHGRVQIQALALTDPARQTHRFRYRWHWIQDPQPAAEDPIA